MSTDLGLTFTAAVFPATVRVLWVSPPLYHRANLRNRSQGRENHYRIVDGSEDVVLVAVSHTATRVSGVCQVIVTPPPGQGARFNITADRALWNLLFPPAGTRTAGFFSLFFFLCY